MSLVRGAFIQFQVVHALVLRETRTRFGRHQLGYIWALFEPLMWVATFWAMYEIVHRKVPHGLDTPTFLVTGVLTFDIFNKNVARIGEAINGNRALLFYPQVQPIDLVWARATLETATLSSVFVVIMLGLAIYRGAWPTIDDPLQIMLGLGLAAGLGSSLGLVFCMLGVLSPTVDRLRGPLFRPLFWISGIFYTLEDLPKKARDLLLYNPTIHVVELVRDGWFHEYRSPHVSATYVLGFILLFFSVGLLLERIVRRRIELS